jgi:ATPase subunit of ABC transporter with duplicated ATPase domains
MESCSFKDANIVIERGQKVAFVGKNGEGKSTMIKAIMKTSKSMAEFRNWS